MTNLLHMYKEKLICKLIWIFGVVDSKAILRALVLIQVRAPHHIVGAPNVVEDAKREAII